MTVKTYLYEFGLGADLHGDDPTKAACRAVADAVRHSSLAFSGDVRERGGRTLVNVTVAVPNPAAVDIDAVKRELPHGDVAVNAISGGLKVEGADVMMACALVTVSAEFPD